MSRDSGSLGPFADRKVADAPATAVPRERTAAFPRILLAAFLGVAALFGGMLCVSALAALRRDPSVSASLLGVAANHTGVLIASLALIMILSRVQPARYGLRAPTRFPILPLLLLACGISAAASLLAAVLPGKGLTIIEAYTLPQTVAFVWIYASIAEETLTRGLIQGFLAPLRDRGTRIGRQFLSLPVIVAAAFFAAMHLALFTMGIDPFTILQIVAFAFAIGLVAGHYRERSGSLLPAILVHALANATGWAMDLLLK
jgi:membrane protease YdiL (CAAX protease family)